MNSLNLGRYCHGRNYMANESIIYISSVLLYISMEISSNSHDQNLISRLLHCSFNQNHPTRVIKIFYPLQIHFLQGHLAALNIHGRATWSPQDPGASLQFREGRVMFGLTLFGGMLWQSSLESLGSSVLGSPKSWLEIFHHVACPVVCQEVPCLSWSGHPQAKNEILTVQLSLCYWGYPLQDSCPFQAVVVYLHGG